MPAFNADRYIAEAIESARSQTFSDWELIVVDDGSTDNTRTIADAYAARDSRIHVVHQPNSGSEAARNRALAEMDTASEYVALLDSDDVWERTALQRLVDVLDANEGAIGVHGVLRFVDANGRAIRVNGSETAPRQRRRIAGWGIRVMSPTEPTTFEALAYGNCIPACATLIRRAAIERAEGFDPDLELGGDWEMWLRVALLGDFVFVNEVMYSYRLHGANTTASSGRKHEWMYTIRRKILALPGLTAAQRRSVSLGYRYYELYRAKGAVRRAGRALRRGRYRQVLAEAGRFGRHCFQAMQRIP